MSEPTRSWKDVLSDEPVNQARAAIYERLMDAQERIAQARQNVGVNHAVISVALDKADEELSDDDRREDLYVSSLAHFIRALGGQLEVRALFPDQAVVIRREPNDRPSVTTIR